MVSTSISTLINKIKPSRLLYIFVNITGYIMQNNYVNVKYGNSEGNEWHIGNGAKQGGVLTH